MKLNFKTAEQRAAIPTDDIWATTPIGEPVRISVSNIVAAVFDEMKNLDIGEYEDGDMVVVLKSDGSIVRAAVATSVQPNPVTGFTITPDHVDVVVTVGSPVTGFTITPDHMDVVVTVGSPVTGFTITPDHVDVVVTVGDPNSFTITPEHIDVVVTVDESIVPAPVVTEGRISTYGNQFIDSDSNTVRLKTVNWFGAEGNNRTPHGTWARAYTDIIDDIAAMGFNCIRLPFSGEFSNTSMTPPAASFDDELNPDFVGKTSLEIFDMIIAYAGTLGLYVVLDHHRAWAGDGADGSPVQSGYTLSDWMATWVVMATRYADNLTVIGADVHNEPHNLDWSTWAGYAEQCGNAIHAVAPEWLIFVEGVGEYNGESYWWGGQLKGVATRPVVLSASNKLVYSPHEYGVSVGSQAWLKSDSNTSVTNWPLNLYPVWTDAWGYIYEQEIAPIWIGEFGGHFGVDGDGTVGAMPNGTFESEWVTELVKYLNGDFNGNGTSDIALDDQGMSFSYWSYNPNSGDTGGLVQDDWTTHQSVKLTLINQLLA